MTKKEAIIKYITEMNTDMLSLVLEDDKSYMDVLKETFLTGLDKVFNKLKNQGFFKFHKVLSGNCGGDCNNGCGGYSFLTEDNQSLDLIFEEENNDIKDIYTCTIFKNHNLIPDKIEIYMSFYEDEKIDYTPTSRHIFLKKEIKLMIEEFNQFKNNVTGLDDFNNWIIRLNNLYENVNTLERFKYNFVNPLSELIFENLNIQELIISYPFAKRAMSDYNKLNTSNEEEIIQWLMKYEENDLSFGNYKKVDNWKQNNLILHSSNQSIVIDCSGYEQSLLFSEIHPKHYWELFEKYKITSEQFKKAKKQYGVKAFDLKTFLKVHNLYTDVLAKIKTS